MTLQKLIASRERQFRMIAKSLRDQTALIKDLTESLERLMAVVCQHEDEITELQRRARSSLVN